MKKPMVIILAGRSGCGKGTQAKLIMEHFGNFQYISTGDLFRDLAKQKTLVAEKIREVMEGGGLPFDNIAIALVLHKIAYTLQKGQSLILDGAVRRVEEAKAIDEFLNWLGFTKNLHFIVIDISRKEAFSRLTKRRICKKCGRLVPYIGEFKNLKKCDKCGGALVERPDDSNVKAVNERLNYYEQRVVKSIAYFKKQKRAIFVNGEQSIENVFKEILLKLK